MIAKGGDYINGKLPLRSTQARPDRRSATVPEVAPEWVEVSDVDCAVSREVSTVVVCWLPACEAKRYFQYAEIYAAH